MTDSGDDDREELIGLVASWLSPQGGDQRQRASRIIDEDPLLSSWPRVCASLDDQQRRIVDLMRQVNELRGKLAVAEQQRDSWRARSGW